MEDKKNYPPEKELENKENRQTIEQEIELDDCSSDMSIFDLADFSDRHNGIPEEDQ